MLTGAFTAHSLRNSGASTPVPVVVILMHLTAWPYSSPWLWASQQVAGYEGRTTLADRTHSHTHNNCAHLMSEVSTIIIYAHACIRTHALDVRGEHGDAVVHELCQVTRPLQPLCRDIVLQAMLGVHPMFVLCMCVCVYARAAGMASTGRREMLMYASFSFWFMTITHPLKLRHPSTFSICCPLPTPAHRPPTSC